VSRFRAGATRTFSSLRIRNYRLYFLGQIVSLSGTWMQSVGQVWLVLKLTGSGVDLGVVVALQFLPVLLGGSWGGVIADRVDKRKLLIVTQTVSGLLALALGVLTVTNVVALWMVYGLALGLGCVTLVDMPARQSFVMEMVGRKDLANAVSLNSVVVNAARVVGPALAGLLIATVGIGICFLVNAVSYVAVVVALVRMRAAELDRGAPIPRKKGQLREGFRYVWSKPDLRVPLLLMAVVGTIAYNFSVTFPLIVHRVFHGGAGVYGVLFAVMGTGAVAGGLVVAAKARATRELLAAATVGFGLAMFAAAYMPSLPLEIAVMLPVGAMSTTFIATSNSLLQLSASREMRGRVMALFAITFLGSTPIGGPFIGWFAQEFGPRSALALGAGSTLAAGLLAANTLRRARRRAALGVSDEERAVEEPRVGQLSSAPDPSAGPAATGSAGRDLTGGRSDEQRRGRRRRAPARWFHADRQQRERRIDRDWAQHPAARR
jgi:MFS family permease